MKKIPVTVVNCKVINNNTIVYQINNSMDYKKHYDKLMQRSKQRTLEGYVEKHHIIPRCLGGTDDIANIAILTPEEHFLAHQLLVKIYPKSFPLVKAAVIMTAHQTQQRANNKLFGWLRRRASLQQKQWIIENGHPKGMLGKKHNADNMDNITIGIKQSAIEKRIEVHTYNLDGSFYKSYSSLIECAKDLKTNASNVKYTAEGKFGHCKNKQIKYTFSDRIAPYVKTSPLKGKKKTEEHRLNQSKAMKGRKRSKEWCEEHSKAMKEYHARKKS
jgi:hypothetical protein